MLDKSAKLDPFSKKREKKKTKSDRFQDIFHPTSPTTGPKLLQETPTFWELL